MKFLFLDDMKGRHRQFKEWFPSQDVDYVFTYADCIKMLERTEYDSVFLDHDLSEQDILCDPQTAKGKTGSDVAEWIVANKQPQQIPMIVVHSLNPVGATNMVNILSSAGFEAVHVMFMLLKELVVFDG